MTLNGNVRSLSLASEMNGANIQSRMALKRNVGSLSLPPKKSCSQKQIPAEKLFGASFPAEFKHLNMYEYATIVSRFLPEMALFQYTQQTFEFGNENSRKFELCRFEFIRVYSSLFPNMREYAENNS